MIALKRKDQGVFSGVRLGLRGCKVDARERESWERGNIVMIECVLGIRKFEMIDSFTSLKNTFSPNVYQR